MAFIIFVEIKLIDSQILVTKMIIHTYSWLLCTQILRVAVTERYLEDLLGVLQILEDHFCACVISNIIEVKDGKSRCVLVCRILMPKQNK